MDSLTYAGVVWDVCRTAREGQAGITRRQLQRLREIVAYARAGSTHYRRIYRGVPEDVSTVGQLPVVTKAELMSHFDEWVTDPSATRAGVDAFLADPDNVGRDFLGRYVVCTTSGATGSPAILLHDHSALAVYNAVGYARSLPTVLLSPRKVWQLLRGRGHLAAVFVTGGHFLGNTMMARRVRRIPWRARTQRIFSAMAPMDELVAELNAFRPVMLSGYPSALVALAHQQQAGRLHIRPMLVSAAGETLSAANRRLIGAAFGCRVSNYYGSSEAVGLTFECAAQRLHVNSDWYIVEPVDASNRPVPAGQFSDGVLITNLANRIQPRVSTHPARPIDAHSAPARRGALHRAGGMGRAERTSGCLLVRPRSYRGQDREGRRATRAESPQRQVPPGLLRGLAARLLTVRVKMVPQCLLQSSLAHPHETIAA